MAVGGVADVRSLAVNEEGMKVIATNGYKKNTTRSVEQTRQSHPPRSSCRACEAAFGCAAVV